MNTIRRNDFGPAVEDVQRRLLGLGYDLEIDGRYLGATEAAVREFRKTERLAQGDTVDAATWAALVDATFALGDRMLYLRIPYFHGCDVRDLQNILNALGFICGSADGIFGAYTERALREFQASTGLTSDGIAGATSFDAIMRLRHAWEGKTAVGAESDGHQGFARAAQVLESTVLCFYGTDDSGQQVASRVSNLAQATTGDARVASVPCPDKAPEGVMLLVGIGTAATPENTHIVTFADDAAFAKRLGAAIGAASCEAPCHIYIEVPMWSAADKGVELDKERWEQHVAIVLLDALCLAMSEGSM